MVEVIIDGKKYCLVPEKEYLKLQKLAALKGSFSGNLSLSQARAYTKKCIKQLSKKER